MSHKKPVCHWLTLEFLALIDFIAYVHSSFNRNVEMSRFLKRAGRKKISQTNISGKLCDIIVFPMPTDKIERRPHDTSTINKSCGFIPKIQWKEKAKYCLNVVKSYVIRLVLVRNNGGITPSTNIINPTKNNFFRLFCGIFFCLQLFEWR